MKTDVLIVGAGPTGLNLALWLNHYGIKIRIVDKAAEAGTTSRALGVHARTLEFYKQMGMAEDVVEQGLKLKDVNLWVAKQHVAHVDIGEFGHGQTPYPYMIIYPQDEHEKLLIGRLAKVGVTVERQTELVDFDDRGHVKARLKKPDGSEEIIEASYLCGCDGARSTVREKLNAGFPGSTYQKYFYVADVDAEGPTINQQLHITFDDADFLGVFPLKGEGRARLIGTVDTTGVDPNHVWTWGDVKKDIVSRFGITVKKVNWFSTYHVHHRVTRYFRRRHVFLLGDAAHIHSPVGAQGMNTGIGDAVNLAWKLAAVLQSRISVNVLDTYEAERIAFARKLVATTDLAFSVVTKTGFIAREIRTKLVPRLVPKLFTFVEFKPVFFRILSQTAINYRKSPLSFGAAGKVRAGDRLPWAGRDGIEVDNFAPFASRDWQVHVYGTPSADVKEICEKRKLALHVFPWKPAMKEIGLLEDGIYLLRPDSYVGWAAPSMSAQGLERYLGERQVISVAAKSSQ